MNVKEILGNLRETLGAPYCVEVKENGRLIFLSHIAGDTRSEAEEYARRQG